MTNLCEWKKKQIEKKFDEFADIVRDPRFACTKCGRVARTKKPLCKPRSLDD